VSGKGITAQSKNIFKYFSWKVMLLLLSLPILMNVIDEIVEFLNFNTFTGSPVSQLIANVSFYIGNWPSLLLKLYPHVLTDDGKVVYEVSGWIIPRTFIINLIGWGIIGFVTSYVIRKSRNEKHQN
jgi:hypothetical protein